MQSYHKAIQEANIAHLRRKRGYRYNLRFLANETGVAGYQLIDISIIILPERHSGIAAVAKHACKYGKSQQRPK